MEDAPVIGWGKKAVALSLKLLQWTNQLTILTDGHPRDWRKEHTSKLLSFGIGVKDEKIVSFDGEPPNVKAAVLSTGERVAVDAMFFVIGTERSCLLAEDLGCEVDRTDRGGRLQADDGRRRVRDRRPRSGLATCDHLGRRRRDRRDRDQSVALRTRPESLESRGQALTRHFLL